MPNYEPCYSADMWALGVCLYLWTFGELPFAGAVPFLIYEKIRAQVRQQRCSARHLHSFPPSAFR